MPLIAGGIRTDTHTTATKPTHDAFARALLAGELIFAAHEARQTMEELAPLLRRQSKLMKKLADPELQKDDLYTTACMESIHLDHQMVGKLRKLALAEQYAETRWQALTPDERAQAAEVWGINPEALSLIAAVWTAWPEIRLPQDVRSHVRRLVGRNSAGYYTGWFDAGYLERSN